MTNRSLAGLALSAALVVAACGSDDDAVPAPSAEPTAAAAGDDRAIVRGAFDEVRADDPTAQAVPYSESAAVVIDTDQVASSAREDGPSGLRTYTDPVDELPEPSIDLSILRSGGPPPDGIPSIDDPVFHDASTVDYLGATDPVIALEVNGDARAYPLDIMIWHELVNDTVGGVPVSVAYCPLCNSVTVYDRELDGRIVDFGVSGLLYNSSLVMFDRQTETLWSHFTGEGLYGALSEVELVARPATVTGFGSWVAEHPDGLVLSRDTGASRDYGRNPYPGYDDVDSDPFLFEGEVDGRYTAMTRVVGVDDAETGTAAAFPLLALRDDGVQESTLGDRDIVAFWAPGATSALDGGQVSGGVDVGTTGVFVPMVDGRELSFRPVLTDDGTGVFVDDQTASTWTVFGEAIEGELAGSTLEQLTHIDTFWFAWIAFHPESAVVV
ncbi:MAG: DUF3179 domain-containing protein [Ilumatobacter sp.]|uniref:DUF3179 domain-containing protein n=1 Tax=Ilumatobacter sp. TaxID=1967498 RepID=UPI00391DA176